MRVRRDVETDFGVCAAYRGEAVQPTLPKICVKSPDVEDRARMSVFPRRARPERKAVYLEVIDVELVAKLRHPVAQVGDVARIAGADVVGRGVDVIADLGKVSGKLGGLDRVSSARTEPNAELAAERARQFALLGKAALELFVELPKQRLVILRPAVVDDVAIEGAEARALHALGDRGERRRDLFGVDVEHMVVPAVELHAERVRDRHVGDIAQKFVRDRVETALFRRAYHERRRRIHAVFRQFGEAARAVVDAARRICCRSVFGDGSLRAEEQVAEIDGLPQPCDRRRHEHALAVRRLPYERVFGDVDLSEHDAHDEGVALNAQRDALAQHSALGGVDVGAHLDARALIDEGVTLFVVGGELHVAKAADAPLPVL